MKMYKVVTVKDGKRFGVYNFFQSPLLKIEYLTDGSWINSKYGNSPLFICKTLEEAITLQRKDTEIWEVEVEDEKIFEPFYPILIPTEDEVFAFYDGKKEIVVDGKKVPIVLDNRLSIGCLSLKMLNKVL